MSITADQALHQVNSAILDVRAGYETLIERADPEILDVARGYDAIHLKHQGEIESRLAARGQGNDDGSIRGAVNRAATILRDMFGGLDADALSMLRQGEEMVLGVYDKALEDWDPAEAPEDRALVAAQAEELRSYAARLPGS